MSTDSVTFVDPQAAQLFKCGICLSILKDPVFTSCSSHPYCFKCIVAMVHRDRMNGTREHNCPECRKKFVTKNVLQNEFIKHQINSLIVKCPNFEITADKASYLSHQKQNKKHHRPISSEKDARSRSRSRSRSRERGNKNNNKEEKEQSENKEENKEENNTNNKNNKISKEKKINNIELCEWSGEWSRLPIHINECPQQLIGCIYCKENMIRKNIEIHHAECPKYPLICHQCKSSKKIRREALQNHIENICGMTKVKCSDCNESLNRKQVFFHKGRDCQEALVYCKYKKYGCAILMRRKNTKNHLREKMEFHLQIVEKDHNKLWDAHKDLMKRTTIIERKVKLRLKQNDSSHLAIPANKHVQPVQFRFVNRNNTNNQFPPFLSNMNNSNNSDNDYDILNIIDNI